MVSCTNKGTNKYQHILSLGDSDSSQNTWCPIRGGEQANRQLCTRGCCSMEEEEMERHQDDIGVPTNEAPCSSSSSAAESLGCRLNQAPLQQCPLAHVFLLSLKDEFNKTGQAATLKLDLGAFFSKRQDPRTHLRRLLYQPGSG